MEIENAALLGYSLHVHYTTYPENVGQTENQKYQQYR